MRMYTARAQQGQGHVTAVATRAQSNNKAKSIAHPWDGGRCLQGVVIVGLRRHTALVTVQLLEKYHCKGGPAGQQIPSAEILEMGE